VSVYYKNNRIFFLNDIVTDTSLRQIVFILIKFKFTFNNISVTFIEMTTHTFTHRTTHT